MTAIFVNFASMFADAGLMGAVIQRKEITEAQVGTLFWINVAICAFLSASIAASAPLIVWIYDEPRLLHLTWAMAAPIFLSGFGMQHRALLTRHMRFGSIAVADLTAMVVSVSVAVLAALAGWGVWALVLMPLTRHFVTSLILISQTGWLPCAPCRHSGVRPMLRFGANFTGASFFNFFSRSVDNFIIGKFFGPALLGQYSRAYGLMITPISQINVPIAKSLFPTLSRLVSDPKEYESVYIKYNQLIAWLVCVPIAVSSLYGEELLIFLLGPEWRLAGQLFAWLAVAGMFQPLTWLSGLVFGTTDRMGAMLRWSMVNAFFVVSSFGVGAWLGGVQGMAVAYACINVALVPVCFAVAFNRSPIRSSRFYKKVGPPMMVALSLASIRFILG